MKRAGPLKSGRILQCISHDRSFGQEFDILLPRVIARVDIDRALDCNNPLQICALKERSG